MHFGKRKCFAFCQSDNDLSSSTGNDTHLRLAENCDIHLLKYNLHVTRVARSRRVEPGILIKVCVCLSRHTNLGIALFFTKKASPKRCIFGKTGNDLSSRLVSKQVYSALVVFTSVFGMRTGVTPLLKSPVMVE